MKAEELLQVIETRLNAAIEDEVEDLIPVVEECLENIKQNGFSRLGD